MVVLELVIELICLLLLVVVDGGHGDSDKSGRTIGYGKRANWFLIGIQLGQSTAWYLFCNQLGGLR